MKTIVRMEFGSSVYGTRVPESDTDYKSVFVPDAREILLQRAPRTVQKTTKVDKTARNTANDIDDEMFSLQQYLKLLAEGQTVSLDMLFTPSRLWLESDLLWSTVQSNKHRLICKKSSSFVGYCQTQAAKYGIKGSRIAAVRNMIDLLEMLPPEDKLHLHWGQIKLFVAGREYCEMTIINNPAGVPEEYVSVCGRKFNGHVTVKHALEIYQKVFDQYGHRARLAEKNEGVDYKALMHAVRVAEEAKELLLTGNITFPRPEADLLLKIRKGEVLYQNIADLIEEGLKLVEDAKAVSALRDEPDFEWIDSFVAEVYGKQVKGRL